MFRTRSPWGYPGGYVVFAEALLLLELHEAGEPLENTARVVRAMVGHMGIDRKLRASEVSPPVVGAKREGPVRVERGGANG